MKKYTKNLVVVLIVLLIILLPIYLINTSNKPSLPSITHRATFDIPNKSIYLKKLRKLSKKHENAKIIINNIENYPAKILDLVLGNPETIDYALEFPDNYPAKNNTIELDKDFRDGEIPLLLQWDKRWGYYNYGDNPIAINGCGPTTLSMVILGLTGEIKYNPKEIAIFSQKNGYYIDGVGTSWTLMSEGAKEFGLLPKEISLNKNIILSTLKDGKPIIASMRKGHFTTTSHYIVLTSITKDGMIIVNDPNSIKRSNDEWDIDVFIKETKNLWSFSK